MIIALTVGSLLGGAAGATIIHASEHHAPAVQSHAAAGYGTSSAT